MTRKEDLKFIEPGKRITCNSIRDKINQMHDDFEKDNFKIETQLEIIIKLAKKENYNADPYEVYGFLIYCCKMNKNTEKFIKELEDLKYGL